MDTIEIPCFIINKTSNAILIDTGDDDTCWVPISLIKDLSTDNESDIDVRHLTQFNKEMCYELTVPVWFATQKGLV